MTDILTNEFPEGDQDGPDVVRGYLVGVKGPLEFKAEDLEGILTFYLTERGAREVEVVSLGLIETYEEEPPIGNGHDLRES